MRMWSGQLLLGRRAALAAAVPPEEQRQASWLQPRQLQLHAINSSTSKGKSDGSSSVESGLHGGDVHGRHDGGGVHPYPVIGTQVPARTRMKSRWKAAATLFWH